MRSNYKNSFLQSLANLTACVQIHSPIFQSDQLLSLQTHPLCEAAYEFIQSQWAPPMGPSTFCFIFFLSPWLARPSLGCQIFLLLTFFFSFHLGTGTRKFQFYIFIAGSSLLSFTEFMTIGKWRNLQRPVILFYFILFLGFIDRIPS
jgi:hypothetical protein